MARSHGRIMATIWNDPDFINLTADAQRLYLFLLSQPDLSHAGLVPLRARRWAKKVKGVTVVDIMDCIQVLSEARFIVVDEDTEEVLVRTFVRNDGVYKQPKVMTRLREDARQIESPVLRAAFKAELSRLPLDELSTAATGRSADGPSTRESVQGVVDALFQDFQDVPEYPSERVLGRVSDTHPSIPLDHEVGEVVDFVVDNTISAGQKADSYPSERVSDTHPDTPRVRACAFPQPPSPSPQPPKDMSAIADATDDAPTPPKALELATRADVDRICDHLADRIEANGSKRPTIGKGWRDAARLMLDRDARTEDEIHAVIDWCQRDDFWRANILSLPKLREKFDQLRLQAERTPRAATGRTQEWQQMQERQMARAIEREREMGLR